MSKRLLALLILTIFILAACSSEQQATVSEVSESTTVSQPTQVAPTEAEPTGVPPTEPEPTEPAVSDAGGSSAASGQMECTLVSDQPDAPAEFVAIFGVKDDDWAVGSETAAVTFVEYGDFQ